MTIDLDDLRALVLDEDEAVFTDEALEAAMAAAGGEEDGNILRAAGIAFMSLAAQYAILGKSIRTDDLAIDTRNRGKDLGEVARSFFAQADAADQAAGSDFFEIVAFGGRPATYTCRVEGSPWPASCCAGTSCDNCVL